jgi:hypothetical protein
MTDPTVNMAAAYAASASAISLALIGVDYYAIVWGLLGALSMLALTAPVTRARAMVTVAASTACAAALAHFLVDMAGGEGNRSAIIAVAFVLGAGAQPVLLAMVETIVARIRAAGGRN